MAGLEIVNGETYALPRGLKIELPEPGNETLIEYLERLAMLEPENPAVRDPLRKLKESK